MLSRRVCSWLHWAYQVHVLGMRDKFLLTAFVHHDDDTNVIHIKAVMVYSLTVFNLK